MSSRERPFDIDRMLDNLSSSTAALRVSSASDGGVPLAQPSSVVGVSSSYGAPPLRPAVPHDVSTVSSVPHDGSVTSMVGSSGGGVLAGVSVLGRSQNKLKLHMLNSVVRRCCGKVSNWGVCVELKNSEGDVVGRNCPSSHANKVSFPWIPTDENQMLIVPANSRRGTAVGVINACYSANDFSPMALDYFEVEELSPQGWVSELTNPDHFKVQEPIKDEKLSLSLREGEGVGTWESVPQVELSDSFQVDDVVVTQGPVKYSFGEVGEVENVLDEHRNLLEDFAKKFNILVQTVDQMQRLVVIQAGVINKNGSSAKTCVSNILHRVTMLEEELGDMEELPPDFPSVVAVVQSILERLDTFRKEVDGDIGLVLDELDSKSEKIITKMGEMFHSLPNSAQVSPPPVSSPSMDINTTFLVDGIQSSLGSMCRSLATLTKEVKASSETSGSASFKNLSFPDEKAIEDWLDNQHNSHGAGIAGFVDAFSCVLHRSGSELKKSEFTSTTISLVDRGYEDREVRVITSCAELKSIPLYYDKGVSPKEGTMVSAFKDHEDWFGRDGMDGTGLDILTTISDCTGTHATYVEDHFPEDAKELKQFAQDTMQVSSHFHTKFQETLRQTFTSLVQFGLQEDKIMQLFSDWMHIICKKLYGFRKKAFSGSQNVSPRKRLARHIFVTCQALAYQQEIVDDGFMKHPSLSNSYVRQLTVVLGQLKPNDAKLKELVLKEIDKALKTQKDAIDRVSKQLGTVERAQEHSKSKVNSLEDKMKLLEKFHPELFRTKK
mmetsp:Transcript_11990/g.17209  ORF Transcript_11990/g.17209 Transcript_11990/m.17209 type:complete len:777 (-) Transcript_11990:242-2572(-)